MSKFIYEIIVSIIIIVSIGGWSFIVFCLGYISGDTNGFGKGYDKGREMALENQKMGHWIKQHIGQITTYKCSECGRTVKDDTGYDVTKDYPYCNCGVKMKGENE